MSDKLVIEMKIVSRVTTEQRAGDQRRRMNRNDFNRQVRVLTIIDKVFRVVTPIFCALVLLAILFTTLWRG